MLSRITGQIAAACLMLIAAAATVGAQELASSFDQLRVLVKAGDTLTVTDHSGREITGKVAELSSSSLALIVKDGRSTLSGGDVTTIRQQRHGDLVKGAKWGFGVGAAFGGLGVVAISGDCRGCSGFAVAAAAFYAAAGTGIGVGVSAATTHQQVIFSKPNVAPTKLTVSPIVTPQRHGVMVSFGF